MRRGLIGVILLCVCLFSGCSAIQKDAKVKPPVAEEEVKEERVPTEEDALDRVLKLMKEEVRIYDVLEHQEVFQAKISEAMVGKSLGGLDAVVADIVKKEMDLYMEKRAKVLLEEENPLYTEDDIKWILERVSTEELYRFIILYETAYFKQNK